MTASKSVFTHVTHFGMTSAHLPLKEGAVPVDFTFNTPVGVCMDRNNNIWVCDTGNDRVLVLDKDLKTIIKVLENPGSDPTPFRMPFHVCPHPTENKVLITDMGNARVVVMNYDKKSISFDFAFGDRATTGGASLQDPNGIALVKTKAGTYDIFVNDEFFHTPEDPLRNRCVRFDSKGKYISEFRTVIDPDGTVHDLIWPQGLSSDAEGNLYLANTGSYEVLKCSAFAPILDNYTIKADKPVVPHSYQTPSGMGIMNIMRDVSVIDERVYIADHKANTISIYSLDGTLESEVSGFRPSWNHGTEPIRSATDVMYYGLEDAALVDPYVTSAGEAKDIFLVSEPFTSRILKIKIKGLGKPEPTVELITSLGDRRDQPDRVGPYPQLNCSTAVFGIQTQPKPLEPTWHWGQPELPTYLKFNPFQQAYMACGKYIANLYGAWYRHLPEQFKDHSGDGAIPPAANLVLDAGNWRITGFKGQTQQLQSLATQLVDGIPPAGNLSLAVYYPKEAMLGQFIPGTPIVLSGNFNTGTVNLYQINPLGKLTNYGLPFGMFGTANGCMRGPQGIAVNNDGEVYIADSLNNRIGKWQILQTGQVVFIKNFVWQDSQAHQPVFTPTDVALDAKNRLFVTDQFNNRICVFDHDGNSLWAVGKEGYWEQGEPDGDKLMLPASLAIDGELLILNDLVNRALKLFKIGDKGLTFVGGISLFKLTKAQGGVWMPYLMYAQDGQVHIADSTYNIVQIFSYDRKQ